MEQSTRDIVRSITQKDTAIFCGAGISYHSGLPLASQLEKEILNALEISEPDIPILLNSNIPFEFFIETIRREVSVDAILEIFSKGEPNTNHAFLAELAKAGFVKNIFTTNFDLLIEKALTKKGLLQKVDFEVYSSEEEFAMVDWCDGKIHIVKLHGCVSNKEEMAITLKAVASKSVTQNKNNLIRTFFSEQMNPKVIVMGYSCSDLFDISPQIELIKENNSEIFFIEHSTNSSEFSTEEISFNKNKNPFYYFRGKRIRMNTDNFVKEVWESLFPANYIFKSNSTSWRENVTKWMNLSVDSDTEGVKHHLPARLYYNIGEYEIAVKHFEKGIAVAQKLGNQITFYSEMGNLGMAFNALGRYPEAKRCLETSVEACSQMENIQGEITQLQALGNVYRNIGDFASALRVYRKAVTLAVRVREPFGISTSIGNMVSLFAHIDEPDEAIKWLKEGLEIVHEIGNKQSEGSMLCHLGIAYFQKGDVGKGKELIQDSIRLTRKIGDRQGECMALLNLSNLNLQMEEYDDCINNSVASLEIAKAIGSRQSKGGSMYSIGSAYLYKGDPKTAIPYLKDAVEIYLDIYGNDHRNTQAAINVLTLAERLPIAHS